MFLHESIVFLQLDTGSIDAVIIPNTDVTQIANILNILLFFKISPLI